MEGLPLKKLYKQISIFVVLTLFVNMITIKVNAADSGTNKTQNTNLTQQGDKKESKIVSEAIEKRDKNIKQFRKEDVSYEAVVYSQPVHYLVNGKWQDIDNTLSDSPDEDKNSVLQNNQNDFKVKFAKNATSNKLVSINKDNYEISWGIILISGLFSIS